MAVVLIWILSACTAVRAFRRKTGSWFDRVCGVVIATIPVIGPIGYFIGFETPSRLPGVQRADPSQFIPGAHAANSAFERDYVWEKTEQLDTGIPGEIPRIGRCVVVMIRVVLLLALVCVAFWTNSLLLNTRSETR